MKPFSILIASLVACLLFSSGSTAQERLVISPEMVYNISARGEAWVLFDDQPIWGPLACPIPSTTDPTASFDGRWNGQDFFFPIKVIVDLGASCELMQVCLQNGKRNKGEVLVEVTEEIPGQWKPLFRHRAKSPMCHPLSFVKGRYLQFTFQSSKANIREIELYATRSNGLICPPPIQACNQQQDCSCPRPPMDQFIGANTSFDIPAEKTNAVGIIRNYQHIFFNEGYHTPNPPPYPNNSYSWSPSLRPDYDHDHFYQSVQDLGQGICADVHKAPTYLTTFAYKNGNPNYNVVHAMEDGLLSDEQVYVKVIERKPFDEKRYPISEEMELTDPNAYIEQADVFYQLSSRYGSPGNPANLKVSPSNEAKHGLGLLQYLENWNEPDKWWHGYLVQNESYLDPKVERRLGYFTPFEYAAMSSAVYDGHGQSDEVENIVRARFGDDIPSGASPLGLRNSKGQLKFAMSGLTEINLDYVRAIKFWFEHHRADIGFPFDVINFHHYSHNEQGGQEQTHGICPKEDGLRERIAKAVEFRDRYLPGVEVWLSEFGYDTHPKSIQSPDCQFYCENCEETACFEKMQEIQGQWVVRSFLEIAAGGADRAMVFTMRDDGPSSSSSIYSTAGLTAYAGPEETGYEAKPAWYYVSTLKQVMKGLQFDADFIHDDPRVRLYRFADSCQSMPREVYAIWSPTSQFGDNRPVISNYALPLAAKEASVVHLQDGDVDGLWRPVSSCDGRLCVDVSERPRFVVIHGDPGTAFQGCDCSYIDFRSSGVTEALALGDEQSLATDLYCGEGIDMQSAFQLSEGDTVILDLAAEHLVDHLFLYSKHEGKGQLEIHLGDEQKWMPLRQWQVRSPRPYKWKSFDLAGRQGRYIRLVAREDDISIGEVKLCGRLAE